MKNIVTSFAFAALFTVLECVDLGRIIFSARCHPIQATVCIESIREVTCENSKHASVGRVDGAGLGNQLRHLVGIVGQKIGHKRFEVGHRERAVRSGRVGVRQNVPEVVLGYTYF